MKLRFDIKTIITEELLTMDEFIRRYEQPILPRRYTKIQHYGYLKNYKRTQRLKQLFAFLQLPAPPPKYRFQFVKGIRKDQHGISYFV